MTFRVTLALLVGVAGCQGAASTEKPAPVAAARDLSVATPRPPAFVLMDVPRFDVHTHVEPGALARAVKLLGQHKIVELVNLSGGSPGGDGLEESLAEARAVGHTVVYVNPDFREIAKGAGYGARIAAKIAEGARQGA